MKMKSKKKSIITIIAVITAIVGAAVAVAAYLKRKARAIGETLDYDASLYYEDDDYLDESEHDAETEEPSDAAFVEKTNTAGEDDPDRDNSF